MKLKLLTMGVIGVVATTFADSFEDDVINVKKAPKFDISTVEFKKVNVYPQATVILNDKNAKFADIDELQVGSVYTGKEIYLVIKWKDDTFSVQPKLTTDRYGDGVSVQFPVSYGKGKTLPYIGMGNEGNPVVVYLRKMVENRDYVKSFVSEAFGSLTEQRDNTFSLQMNYDKDKKEYTAIFKKVVKPADIKAGVIPVAFAVWDGDSLNRGGKKNISSWKFLKIEGVNPDKSYISYLSWGYGNIGDPNRGKELMVQNGCNGCHNYADQSNALPDLAPNLSKIGGYSNPVYLRESIINPSAVVIRNLNINRHYDKSQQPDKNGSYPNNEMYTWYTKDQKGKRVSKMPPYNYLSEQDVNDIVAYLKTLK
ncbi:MAG: ethylbenzene dehydrogenase-related protein [Hydrogenothermaceae bacterium]